LRMKGRSMARISHFCFDHNGSLPERASWEVDVEAHACSIRRAMGPVTVLLGFVPEIIEIQGT